MMIDNLIKNLEGELVKTVDTVKSDLQSLRSNRPSAKLVEDIKVEAYGQIMPLKQLSTISIVPPREIDISFWDKSVSSAIAKAIEAAIKIIPISENNLFRINLPSLTEERKKELIKLCGKTVEETRIKIRSLRDECNKKTAQAEEDGSISEDEKFRIKEKIQKIVDEANKKVEEALSLKVKEIEE